MAADQVSTHGDLYRFFDCEGELLYIGLSLNAVARATQHRGDKFWWDDIASMTIEKVPLAQLAQREAEAIQQEHPLHNRHRPASSARTVRERRIVVRPATKWAGKAEIGRYGAIVSWSRTPDRSARTRPARRRSPSSIEWHIDRLGPEFDGATDQQRVAAAEQAKQAYYRELAARSAAVRAAKKLSKEASSRGR